MLNIIVSLAKIVKDFGTSKEIEEKNGNMAKSKIYFGRPFLKREVTMLIV